MIVAGLLSTAVIILIYNFTSNSEGRFVKANEPINTPSTPLTVINNENFAGTTNTHRFDIPAGFSYVKVSLKTRVRNTSRSRLIKDLLVEPQ